MNVVITVSGTGLLDQFTAYTGDVAQRVSDLDGRWQGGTYPGGDGAGMSTAGTSALKDLCRPRLRGYRAQIQPVPVNAAGDLRQISDRQIHGVANGRNRGALLTIGVRHTTLAALQAATVASGTFDWYGGENGDGAYCKTRFGSQGGVFTVSAWEGATAADRTLAQVWRRVLLEDCGYAAGDISAADVAALDASCPWEAGVWAGTGERTRRNVLDDLCNGVATYYDDDAGVWRLAYDGADAGVPAVTFRQLLDDDDAPLGHVPYLSLELVAATDQTKGLPVCGVDVGFAPRDYVLSSGDLAGDDTAPTDPVGGAAARAELTSDVLTEAWPPGGSDQAVIASWGERRLTVKTSLRYREHASAHGQRLYAVHSVLRDRFRATVALTPETAQARPGGHVGVHSSRYGLSAGWVCRVNGRALEGTRITFDLLEAP